MSFTHGSLLSRSGMPCARITLFSTFPVVQVMHHIVLLGAGASKRSDSHQPVETLAYELGEKRGTNRLRDIGTAVLLHLSEIGGDQSDVVRAHFAVRRPGKEQRQGKAVGIATPAQCLQREFSGTQIR